MSFAFFLSSMLSLGLLAFLLIAPPARLVEIHILIGLLGAALLLMAMVTRSGGHRR